jgi:hypothetical protein
MDNPQSSHLRLVTDIDKLSLDDVLIKPGHADFVDPNAPEPERKAQEQREPRPRLSPSKAPFVRVLLSSIAGSRIFTSTARLYLVLCYRTHEGQDRIRLTAKIAAEANIMPRTQTRAVRDLERLGVIRVERQKGRSLLVEML